LIAGVAAAIFVSVRGTLQERRMVVARGLIGSEKEEYFRDERVIAALRRLGLTVEFEKSGSREMSQKLHNGTYDFGFPAGVPAAEKIRQEWKIGSQGYDVFFTPMAVASWKPIADLLVTNNVAHLDNGIYTLDMAAFLQLVREGKRWNELAGNKVFDANRSILINSTDITRSNSAAMYLALSSYVANGDNVVENQEQLNSVLPQVTELFTKQGLTAYSSEEPFEDYLSMGMGKAPLVMIYESQFLAEAAKADGNIRSDMVLMYPNPSLFSKHVLVPLTENGKRLGEALQNDAELRQLAIEYGLRNSDTQAFAKFLQAHNLSAPANFINVADVPTFDVLETMITDIAAQK
jgi:hypothetical protein